MLAANFLTCLLCHLHPIQTGHLSSCPISTVYEATSRNIRNHAFPRLGFASTNSVQHRFVATCMYLHLNHLFHRSNLLTAIAESAGPFPLCYLCYLLCSSLTASVRLTLLYCVRSRRVRKVHLSSCLLRLLLILMSTPFRIGHSSDGRWGLDLTTITLSQIDCKGASVRARYQDFGRAAAERAGCSGSGQPREQRERREARRNYDLYGISI